MDTRIVVYPLPHDYTNHQLLDHFQSAIGQVDHVERLFSDMVLITFTTKRDAVLAVGSTYIVQGKPVIVESYQRILHDCLFFSCAYTISETYFKVTVGQDLVNSLLSDAKFLHDVTNEFENVPWCQFWVESPVSVGITFQSQDFAKHSITSHYSAAMKSAFRLNTALKAQTHLLQPIQTFGESRKVSTAAVQIVIPVSIDTWTFMNQFPNGSTYQGGDIATENNSLIKLKFRRSTTKEQVQKGRDCLITYMNKIQNVHIPVSKGMKKMLVKNKNETFMNKHLKRHKMNCLWRVAENTAEITALKSNHENIKRLFETTFVERKVPLSAFQVALLSPLEIRQWLLQKLLPESKATTVPVIDFENNVISVVDIAERIEKTVDVVKRKLTEIPKGGKSPPLKRKPLLAEKSASSDHDSAVELDEDSTSLLGFEITGEAEAQTEATVNSVPIDLNKTQEGRTREQLDQSEPEQHKEASQENKDRKADESNEKEEMPNEEQIQPKSEAEAVAVAKTTTDIQPANVDEASVNEESINHLLHEEPEHSNYTIVHDENADTKRENSMHDDLELPRDLEGTESSSSKQSFKDDENTDQGLQRQSKTKDSGPNSVDEEYRIQEGASAWPLTQLDSTSTVGEEYDLAAGGGGVHGAAKEQSKLSETIGNQSDYKASPEDDLVSTISEDVKANQKRQISFLTNDQILFVAKHLGMSDDLLAHLRSRFPDAEGFRQTLIDRCANISDPERLWAALLQLIPGASANTGNTPPSRFSGPPNVSYSGGFGNDASQQEFGFSDIPGFASTLSGPGMSYMHNPRADAFSRFPAFSPSPSLFPPSAFHSLGHGNVGHSAMSWSAQQHGTQHPSYFQQQFQQPGFFGAPVPDPASTQPQQAQAQGRAQGTSSDSALQAKETPEDQPQRDKTAKNASVAAEIWPLFRMEIQALHSSYEAYLRQTIAHTEAQMQHRMEYEFHTRLQHAMDTQAQVHLAQTRALETKFLALVEAVRANNAEMNQDGVIVVNVSETGSGSTVPSEAHPRNA